MVNLKKSLFVFFLFNFLFCFCFAQESNGLTIDDSNNTEVIDESNILFDNSSFSSSEKSSESNQTSTTGYLVRIIVVLIIVIALIYTVFWYLKKKTNFVKNEDEFLRRAAYLNIAPGKTVEVITLIDKAYLIGVTEDNITMLGEITDKELINAMNVNSDKNKNVKKPLNFAEVLDIFTAKGKNKSNVFAETEQQVDNMFVQNQETTEKN